MEVRGNRGACVAVALLAGTSLQASTITFEPSDYSISGGSQVATPLGDGRAIGGQGNLAGGTPAKATWTSSSAFAVVANAGKNGTGDTGLVEASGAGQFASVYYTPTAGELANIPFSATSSKAHYSLDARLVSHNVSTAVMGIYAGYVSGAAYAIRWNLLGNGDLKTSGGTTLKSGLFSDGGYHTITGDIDYGAKTYSVTIDGTRVNFGTPQAPVWTHGFDAAGAFSGYGGWGLNTRDTGANGVVAFDNLVFTVPEPAALGTVLLAGGAFLKRRRAR